MPLCLSLSNTEIDRGEGSCDGPTCTSSCYTPEVGISADNTLPLSLIMILISTNHILSIKTTNLTCGDNNQIIHKIKTMSEADSITYLVVCNVVHISKVLAGGEQCTRAKHRYDALCTVLQRYTSDQQRYQQNDGNNCCHINHLRDKRR